MSYYSQCSTAQHVILEYSTVTEAVAATLGATIPGPVQSRAETEGGLPLSVLIGGRLNVTFRGYAIRSTESKE